MKKLFFIFTLSSLLISTSTNIYAMEEATGEATPESDLRASSGGSSWVFASGDIKPIDNNEPGYEKKSKASSISVQIYSPEPQLKNWEEPILIKPEDFLQGDGEIEILLDINTLGPLFERLFTTLQDKALNPQQNNNQCNIPEEIETIISLNNKMYHHAGFLKGQQEIPTAISVYSPGYDGNEVELHSVDLGVKHYRKNIKNKDNTHVALNIDELAPALARIFKQQQIADELHMGQEKTRIIPPLEIKRDLDENNLLYFGAGIIIGHQEMRETQSLIVRHPKTILASAVLTTAVVCTAAGYFGSKQ